MELENKPPRCSAWFCSNLCVTLSWVLCVHHVFSGKMRRMESFIFILFKKIVLFFQILYGALIRKITSLSSFRLKGWSPTTNLPACLPLYQHNMGTPPQTARIPQKTILFICIYLKSSHKKTIWIIGNTMIVFTLTLIIIKLYDLQIVIGCWIVDVTQVPRWCT